MTLFEIHPGEAPDQKFSIWHLDLDQVVSIKDWIDEGTTRWWVETTSGQNFFVTKACFNRMMRAWESR